MTFGENITPGNTVVLFIGVNMGTADISTSSVTTNGSGDNWTFPTYTGFYNNVGISGYALDFNSAGGSAVVDYSITQSVAATTSETTSVLLDAFEVAGLGPNPSVDTTTAGFNGGSTTTTWTSGSYPGDPAGANNGIFLGSVCLDINAANTTSTVAGPAGWTNESLLSGSFQAGGTGTANKFFVYQLSGFSGPYNSSPPVLVYSGTNSAAAYTYGAWGISLFNGIIPDWWDGPIQALLPHPPAGIGSIRGGRVTSNQGAPVSNPAPPTTGPVFYPARQAIRAKLPQQPSGPGLSRDASSSSPAHPYGTPPRGRFSGRSPPRSVMPCRRGSPARDGSAPASALQSRTRSTGHLSTHRTVRCARGSPARSPGRSLPSGRPAALSRPRSTARASATAWAAAAPPSGTRPQVPVFHPAVQPVRARPARNFISAGRITSSPGAPLRNPFRDPSSIPQFRSCGQVPPSAAPARQGRLEPRSPGTEPGRRHRCSIRQCSPVRAPVAAQAFSKGALAFNAGHPVAQPHRRSGLPPGGFPRGQGAPHLAATRAGRFQPRRPDPDPGCHRPPVPPADEPCADPPVATPSGADCLQRRRSRTEPGSPEQLRVPPVLPVPARPVPVIPQQRSAGRTGSAIPGRVKHPAASPGLPAAVRPVRPSATSAPFSRAASPPSPGAPVVNPGQGPAFRQATAPARARTPLPPGGRV